MSRNDRSTIVLGLMVLLAVLAVTVPASAMNDPVTGRWITRDPLYNRVPMPPLGQLIAMARVGADLIEQQGAVNVYEAVRDDPVNRLDPDGRCALRTNCDSMRPTRSESAVRFTAPDGVIRRLHLRGVALLRPGTG